jgi:hypothetical protein
VSLTVSNGEINLAEATVESKKDDVSIESNGDLKADSASLYTRDGKVSLTASNGEIDLVDATVESKEDDVSIESNGDIRANKLWIKSGNGAITADLGTTDATLYIDEATIDDGDNAIAYQPNGVRVVPSDGPATGS